METGKNILCDQVGGKWERQFVLNKYLVNRQGPGNLEHPILLKYLKN